MRKLCSWAKNLGNITSRLNIAVAKFSLTDALLTYFVTFPKDKDGFLHVFFYTLYKALPIVSDVVPDLHINCYYQCKKMNKIMQT